jgi:hypothetical protein
VAVTIYPEARGYGQRQGSSAFEHIKQELNNCHQCLHVGINMPYRTNTRLDAVICFDEARGLMSTDGQLQVKTSTMFRSMRRALKDFYEKTDKKIFCLTMDTVSRVSSFAPPNTNDESLRTFEEFEGTTLELFPPIYCIDSMDLIPFSRVVDHKNTESYIAYKLMAFNNTFIFNTIQQMISIIKQHKNMFSTWNNSVVLKWVEIVIDHPAVQGRY